jgi:hypothetical protein
MGSNVPVLRLATESSGNSSKEFDGASRQLLPAGIPKLSFAASILSLSCIAGSIAVVYTSNGHVICQWIPHVASIQASVLLAILFGIFNASIGLILSGDVMLCKAKTAQLLPNCIIPGTKGSGRV